MYAEMLAASEDLSKVINQHIVVEYQLYVLLFGSCDNVESTKWKQELDGWCVKGFIK